MRQATSQRVTLRWVPGPAGSNRAQVEASGLLPSEQLNVYSGEQRETPMAGTTRQVGYLTIFEPRFALLPGTVYTAVCGTASARYRLPDPAPAPPTHVVQVYPSADRLPLNLLKFYIHFSAPMSRGSAYSFIRLLKADGTPVELPFLELAEELWNPEATRLTLLFDPGRIKRGVKPLEDIGGALELGRHYTLEISSHWRDGRSSPLAAPFRKRFLVTPADRTPIEPTRWRLLPPHVGTREPLQVHFPEPLDHALAQRLLTVEQVPGTVVLDDQERRWCFTPKAPWQRRLYFLRASPLLEDLAGNNIGKAFDVDLSRPPAPFRNTPVRLPFSLR